MEGKSGVKPEQPRTRGDGPRRGAVAAACALSLVAGAALGLTLRPLSWWPLLFVGLIPMVVAQYRLLPRRRSWLAPGLAAFAFEAVTMGLGAVPLSPALAIVFPLLIAVAVAVLTAADRPFSEATQFRFFVLQVPLLWAAIEVLRSGNPLVGTLGTPVYGLASWPWFIQPISVFGMSALMLLVLVIDYTLALAVLRIMDRRGIGIGAPVPSRPVRVAAAAAGGALVAWCVIAALVWSHVNSELGPKVRVAAVQPGPVAGSEFGTNTKDTPAVRAALTRATRRAASAGAKLVVWPEEMLTFNVPRASAARERWVTRLVRSTGVYLITGYGDPVDTYNRAAVFTPSGEVLRPTYGKAHPVVLEGEDYTPGSSFPSWDTRIGNLGIAICFDYMFLGPVRYTTLSGARLVAVPAWDWGAIAGVRPWDALVFRAVENRVSVVKAERAWDSVIVDANGEVKADTDVTSENGEPALLIADVHLGPRGSPYLWLGNWTGWLVLAGFAGLAVGCVRTLRRSVQTADGHG